MKYFYVERQKIFNRSVNCWAALLMLFFMVVVSGTSVKSQILTDFPCYAVSEDNLQNVLFAYDPATNEWGAVGTATTINIEAIATDPVANIVYAIDEGQFGSLDTNNGAFIPIGTGLGVATGPGGVAIDLNDVDGLTYDAVNMLMYGSHRVTGEGPGSNDLLFQIDVATGSFVAGAMVDPATGTPVDFVFVPQAFEESLNGDVYDVDDIAYNPYTGQLLAIQNQDGPGVITELDVLTGEVIQTIFDIEDNDVEGLGFTYLGELYATTGDNSPNPANRNTFIFIDLVNEVTETLIFIDEGGPNVDFESFDCFTSFNDLALDKVLDPATTTLYPGDDVTFFITVYNQGGFVNSDITITDYIPEGLILNDPSWTSVSGSMANIIIPGPLETGANVTIPITFTVNPAYTGDGDAATEDILTNAAEISQSFNVNVIDLDGNQIPLPDFDSQPDDQNNETNIVDNEINQGGPFANADEDDHDIAPVKIDQLGTISGNVGEDVNNDDAPDEAIPGTTIELYDNNGTLVATTTTDANGDYIFTDLLVGEYIVVEIQPPGLIDVTEGDQTPEDGEPTVDTPLDNVIAVTLSSGEDDEDNDFVEEASCPTCDEAVATACDDGDPCTENDLERLIVCLDGTEILCIPCAGTPIDCNCESISGEVFIDTNNNGCKNENETTDAAGIEVTLWECDPATGEPSAAVSTATTGADGSYTFGGGTPPNECTLDPNTTYTIQFDIPQNSEYADYTFSNGTADATCDADAADDVDPATGIANMCFDPANDDPTDGDEDEHVNAGITPPCQSISGEVFIDANNNGCKDEDETADAAGVEVTLLECDPATGEPSTPVSSITTGPDGTYTFGGTQGSGGCLLDPSTTYTIQFDIPENTAFSSNDASDECAPEDRDDVDPATGIAETCFDPSNDDPTDGDEDEHVNVGIVPFGSISGNVGEDTNNDDVPDNPIPGTTIELYDENGNLVDTVVTDENGDFEFTNVPPGEYTVVEIQPPGFVDVTEGDQTPEDGEPTVDTPIDNVITVIVTPGEDDEDNDFVEESICLTFNIHTSDDQTICPGESVEICASGADEYWWSNGEDVACITVSPHHTKTYSVKGMKDGCEAVKDVTVIVNDSFNLYTSEDQHICAGKSVEICASGANGYWWSNGEDIACITVSPHHTKTYSVKGMKDGCEAVKDVTVIVNDSFNLYTSEDQHICAGKSVEICASGADGYWWSNGEDVACITVSPHHTKTYSVKGMKDGCEAVKDVTVIVNESFNLHISDEIVQGKHVELCASGADTYWWRHDEDDACITVSPDETTTYSVIGYKNGCDAYADITIEVQTNGNSCKIDDINLEEFLVDSDKATINWTSYNNAWYTLYIRKEGSQKWEEFEIEYSTVDLTNLYPCTTYQWAISVKCSNGGVSDICDYSSFTTSGYCGYGRLINPAGIGVNQSNEATFNGIDVYPNPATSVLRIEYKELPVKQITIYNSLGKLIEYAKVDASGTAIVEVNNYANGVYLIMTQANDKIYKNVFVVD